MAAPINPKTSNMTESQRQECFSLRSEGWTIEQLSKKYGRNRRTIGRMIERKGGKPGRQLYHQDAGAEVAPEYNSWRGMKKRCYQESDKDYHNYGARGITVCDRWLNSYPNFLADMGRRPSIEYTLERLKNELGYFPENCVWATRDQQSRNRRNNLTVTIDGKSMSLSEASALRSANQTRVRNRLNAGWDTETAFSKPPRSQHGK